VNESTGNATTREGPAMTKVVAIAMSFVTLVNMGHGVLVEDIEVNDDMTCVCHIQST
jgi:hypothetical protein